MRAGWLRVGVCGVYVGRCCGGSIGGVNNNGVSGLCAIEGGMPDMRA